VSALSAGPGGVSDRFAGELALGAPEPLGAFNRAGVLSAADVHVARALLSLAGLGAGEARSRAVALAAALAVRAPRLGHVFVDVDTVAATVAADGVELSVGELAWPEPAAWRAALVACEPLVASGEAEATGSALRPLRLVGSHLYLDRYWRQERSLAAILLRLDGHPVGGPALPALAELLERLFPDPQDSAQRAAGASAALRGLTVVAGGPGTGKTTTVARTVALLAELAAASAATAPLVALCAPTGKAAARLAQAISAEAGTLNISAEAAGAIDALSASTIHRLLGARGEGRFRHTAANPLPHDVVIVDETSMVSLSLISHLLAAVRTDARVVLVGDPDQLSAIEAGAVLRDIVGPASSGPTFGAGMRSMLSRVTGADPGPAVLEATFGSGVVVLRRGHRFGAPIGALAEAIRVGDADAAVAALSGASPSGDGSDSGGRGGDVTADIRWLDVDAAELATEPAAVAALRTVAVAEFGALISAARAGDAATALDALGSLRLLCAHRLGRYGVRSWTLTVEEWLSEALGFGLEGDYAGRPLMVTENDYELALYNGDSGVVVATTTGDGGSDLSGPDGESVAATFDHENGLLRVAPARLAAVETAFATTIHKSQGSQFSTAAVILPEPDSRLLSRELLYTAVTRASSHLIVVGTEASLRAAVARPVQRATGLRDRLWGG
jgi:exodeoxyribonuclease V alpha subunit